MLCNNKIQMISQKDRWLQNVVIMSQYENVVIHEAK